MLEAALVGGQDVAGLHRRSVAVEHLTETVWQAIKTLEETAGRTGSLA